jgi:hypothetical protein
MLIAGHRHRPAAAGFGWKICVNSARSVWVREEMDAVTSPSVELSSYRDQHFKVKYV